MESVGQSRTDDAGQSRPRTAARDPIRQERSGVVDLQDCLLLVDVLSDFDHEDGERLLESFRSRYDGLRALLADQRARPVPVVYANDSRDVFDGDVRALVDRARLGPAGRLVAEIAPRRGDRFVVKPRYSAFDATPLELILRELDADRILLAGMSSEGCVTQTAIAAREAGFKVTVVPSACATVDPDLEAIALAYLERVVGVQLAPSPGVVPKQVRG